MFCDLSPRVFKKFTYTHKPCPALPRSDPEVRGKEGTQNTGI